jgi:ATP phosphoribosyltransferase
MNLTPESELFRKAVDQLGSLQSRYEADRISAEAFKLAVETIWAVLGGVVDTQEFVDLMWAANQEMLGLPKEARIRVLINNGRQLTIVRHDDEVIAMHAVNPTTRARKFDVEDEAVDLVAALTTKAINGGFRRVI